MGVQISLFFLLRPFFPFQFFPINNSHFDCRKCYKNYCFKIKIYLQIYFLNIKKDFNFAFNLCGGKFENVTKDIRICNCKTMTKMHADVFCLVTIMIKNWWGIWNFFSVFINWHRKKSSQMEHTWTYFRERYCLLDVALLNERWPLSALFN